MSTLAEIEEAVALLPPEDWVELRRWMNSHAPESQNTGLSGRVDWSKSAAVTRPRPPQTRLAAEVVMEALATVRE
jgi:hypothetical protein